MDAQNTGRFISLLRKEKGMTQTALADKLNISNRTVSKWEHGDGFPDITVLPELAQALSVSVDELLKGERGDNAVRVTEVENRDNLNNFFLITYVVSLFIAVFSALLGGITEIYCIWAFQILFYTHWEIVFAVISLFSVVLSGLIFSIGLTRLNVSYSREEIMTKTKNKIWTMSAILSVFPVAFWLRIINMFIPTEVVWVLIAVYFVVLLVVLWCVYHRKSEQKVSVTSL